jgi:hypothetical protein
MKLVVTHFQWIHYNQDTVGVDLQVPQQNRRTQTFRDALQSARHSTSYDPRDNDRRTQTSRDALRLRDSQLVMIQETITEAPKVIRIKKDNL